jgi:hypothetical protein
MPNPNVPAAITQRYRANPFSPPAYGGLAQLNMDFVEQDYTYLSPVITLTPTQILVDQTISIDNDSDYEWRAITVPVRTGAYEVQFFDAQNNPLSNTPISYLNFQNASNGSFPYPLTPAVLIPMAGVIKYNITNLTVTPNVIQLAMRGVKRFRYMA